MWMNMGPVSTLAIDGRQPPGFFAPQGQRPSADIAAETMPAQEAVAVELTQHVHRERQTPLHHI